MTEARYKSPQMQRVYDVLLNLAADCTSELYWKGQPRRGASHRCAFWDGFNGLKKTPAAIPGTLSWACYQAGKEWARRQRLTNDSHQG
mgnify:CR=1 FL=1